VHSQVVLVPLTQFQVHLLPTLVAAVADKTQQEQQELAAQAEVVLVA